MTIKEIIEKGIAGGWKVKNPYNKTYSTEEILLSPLFWQAVGKVKGWEEVEGTRGFLEKEVITMQGWEVKMYEMIDALTEAATKPDFDMQKTIEQFISTL